MRTITAVVNGTEATWIEASEFHPDGCLRLWVEEWFPKDLLGQIAEVFSFTQRNHLSVTRAFVMEPKGFKGPRPAWAAEPEELDFHDTFSLERAGLSACKSERTSGPLLVSWCVVTQRWLAAALEDDWQKWSLNMNVLFGSGCRLVRDNAVWQLPSRPPVHPGHSDEGPGRS